MKTHEETHADFTIKSRIKVADTSQYQQSPMRLTTFEIH